MLPCGVDGGHNYDQQVFDVEMGEKEAEQCMGQVELETPRSVAFAAI